MSELKQFGHSERNARKHLGSLIASVRVFQMQMEAIMLSQSSGERGKKIAEAVNALERCNDNALYFGLGFDFRKDGKTKRPNIKAIIKHSRKMYTEVKP